MAENRRRLKFSKNKTKPITFCIYIVWNISMFSIIFFVETLVHEPRIELNALYSITRKCNSIARVLHTKCEFILSHATVLRSMNYHSGYWVCIGSASSICLSFSVYFVANPPPPTTVIFCVSHFFQLIFTLRFNCVLVTLLLNVYTNRILVVILHTSKKKKKETTK